MRLLVVVATAAMLALVEAGQLESSMTDDQRHEMPSFRFKGFATTTTSTSTVFSSTTTWVRATRTCKLAGTPSCNYTPPPPPPVTSTTSTMSTVPNPPPATATSTINPTVTATVTATPLLQINVNKPPARPPAVNLVEMMNKPIDVSITAGVSASISGSKPKELAEDVVAPSGVNSVEMTASPVEVRSPRREFDLETSLSDSNENEYELIGLGEPDDSSVRFFNKITIAHVRRTTVTLVSTATSTFPVVAATDQVTVAFGGCIPKDAPIPLPDC